MIKKLKITPENQDNKLAMKAQMQTEWETAAADPLSAWAGADPLSDKVADAMATIIRELGSQEGGRKKEPRSKKRGEAI